MFDQHAAPASAPQCADRLAALVVEGRRWAAERLACVADWADLHPAREDRAHRPYGGDGTPGVAEHAAVELGVLLQVSTVTAAMLLRDALDLRHRLPRVWDAVMTGRVEVWVARKVARATVDLTLAQARWVDEQTVRALVGLPPGRAMTVVEAKVIAADPVAHEERLAEAMQRRYVAKSRRDNPYGLRTLLATTTAGDVARMEAMVDYLAGLLLAAGHTDTLPVRRAMAFGMLANPAAACVFMARTTGARAAAHAARARRDHACAGTAACDCPEGLGRDPQPQPQHDEAAQRPDDRPAPEAEPEPLSAVHAALALGRLLEKQGSRVLDRLRPRTVLYVHVAAEGVGAAATAPDAPAGTDPDMSAGLGPVAPASDAQPDVAAPQADLGGEQVVPGPLAVARVEGLGPVTLPQLREWLTGALGVDAVTVRPVLDWAGQTPVDAYEVPATMREALHALHPFEVFPWGTLPARGADADHTDPYRDPGRGGPAGQTHVGNLGPLARGHHNAKTHGGFEHHQPLPGVHVWRTPTGHWYQVDHTGTRALGRERPRILRPRRADASVLDLAFANLLVEAA